VTRAAGIEQTFVKSLERGLAVIRALSPPGPGLTITEVAEATGLTRAAARRSLLTLKELGYVGGDGRRFLLTPKVLELGYAYLSSLNLPQIAQPHIERLAEEVQESAAVSVLDGDEIVCIGGVTTKRIMTVSVRVGGRLPVHVTAAGRVLLAALDLEEAEEIIDAAELPSFTPWTITSRDELRAEIERVRAQGWCLAHQDFEEGLLVLAVPVRNPAGAAVAAASVFTHTSRTAADDAPKTLLPALRAAAEGVERDLALVGRPGSADGRPS
jgi:IclR family pca regulon transcriptional regulator